MPEPFSKDKIKELVKQSLSKKNNFSQKKFIKLTVLEIFRRTPKHWWANNQTTSPIDNKMIKGTPKHLFNNKEMPPFLSKKAIRYFLHKSRNEHVVASLQYLEKNVSDEELFELFLTNSERRYKKIKIKELREEKRRGKPKADAFFRSSQGGSFSPR